MRSNLDGFDYQAKFIYLIIGRYQTTAGYRKMKLAAFHIMAKNGVWEGKGLTEGAEGTFGDLKMSFDGDGAYISIYIKTH